jgi:aminoglycoside phosphotransferase
MLRLAAARGNLLAALHAHRERSRLTAAHPRGTTMTDDETRDETHAEILAWSQSVLGPCEVVSGDARFHGRTTVSKLRARGGDAYLKIHADRATWEPEAHGYEQWASAFGAQTPKLLGVYDAGPFAILTSDMGGSNLEDAALSPEKQRDAWRDAGRALVALHDHAVGTHFGTPTRDGSVATPGADAVEYIAAEFVDLMGRAEQTGWLSPGERAVVERARALIPAFEGERPTPCHRDYCPVNWIVDANGAWLGVIDYEFARWDVRVTDFSRYPDWDWMLRPDLTDAFMTGYGRPLTTVEQEQLLVARAKYVLGAVVWGRENAFYGFEQEGRDALVVLSGLLP